VGIECGLEDVGAVIDKSQQVSRLTICEMKPWVGLLTPVNVVSPDGVALPASRSDLRLRGFGVNIPKVEARR
jgi:hypothetical protein